MANLTALISFDDVAPAPAPARLAWHAGWLTCALAAALVWAILPNSAPFAWALTAASLGGGAGLLLGPSLAEGADLILLSLWTGGVTAAVLLSGGLSGPLAAMTLAPLAAARLVGGRRGLAGGATLFIASLAILALAQASGLRPAGPAPVLAVLSILMTGAAVGAAFLLARDRSVARDTPAGDSAPTTDQAPPAATAPPFGSRAETLLEGQGLLILDLSPAGEIRAAFGRNFISGDKPFGALRVLAGDPAAVDEALAEAARQGRVEFRFTSVAVPDGLVAAVLTVIDDGLIAVLRDATGEQAREAALERTAAEALAVSAGKSRFLANMSHELRTPLNAVVGFSDIMRGQMFGPLAPKYAEYAELIHESGGHLLDLINDILDISKIEAERYELAMEAFDARDAVAAALRLMRGQAETGDVRLKSVLGPEPILVRADRRALKQIVFNLVSNGLKFTPMGGSVTVGLRAADDALELVVGDTGLGIAPADLERLGTPFEQAGGAEQKARGAGLGLSLVRALTELHGGTMSIQSTLGDGTVVAVRLPVLTAQAPARPAVAAPAPAEPEPPRGANVIAFSPNR